MDEDFTSESPSLVTCGKALYIRSVIQEERRQLCIRLLCVYSPRYYAMAVQQCIICSESNLCRLSDHYGFMKPNDRRALDLMNAAAVEVMKELPDLCIAYGVSDEYRYVQLVSSLSSQILTVFLQFCFPSQLPTFRAAQWVSISSLLLSVQCNLQERPLIGALPSRKLVTTIVSTFTAHYIYKWSEFFPERPLLPPYLPSFDGRAVIYPNNQILRDYMSWRQVDCKWPRNALVSGYIRLTQYH